ncbi:MAG: hypothetical protein LUE98_13830 [Tannerellaceae bacterium]|nr:hypothetical protein [Tannerellaceae bacterium]
MSAKYYLFKNPPNPDKPDEQTYHVRLTQRGTVSFREICEEVAFMCTISVPDCIGTIAALRHVMVRYMKRGYNVEIEEFGYFKAAIKAPIVTNPHDIQAGDIRFASVLFRPCTELKEKMKTMDFVRDPAYRHAAVRPEQQRIARILSHLSKEQFIRSSDCMRINGCTRYLAQKDLEDMCQKGLITAMGQAATRFYVLTHQNTNP